MMAHITFIVRDPADIERQTPLLAALGISPAQTKIAALDEIPQKKERPKDFSLRMVKNMIAETDENKITIAAYRAIACGRRILLPTRDEQTARKYLDLLSGRTHRVWTALAVISGNTPAYRIAQSRVRLKRPDKAEISRLITGRQWLNQPGGYVWPGLAAALITRSQGAPGNLSGLPLAMLSAMMPPLALHEAKPMR